MQERIRQQEALRAINEFSKANKEYWDSFAPPPDSLSEEVILVDCLVSFPPYVLGTLIISKYLQKLTNARIVALVRDEKQLNWCKWLLNSFSVKKTYLVNKDLKLNYNLDVSNLKNETDPRRLRKRILDININGLPVGDLIYDAYLRDTGEPTIFRFNDTLHTYINYAIYYNRLYNNLITANNVRAVIMGHTIYLMYGMLAHMAVSKGIPVFGRKPGTSPLAITRYTTLADLRRYEVGFRKEDFEYFHDVRGRETELFANDYLSRRFKGIVSTEVESYSPECFSREKQTYSREELVKKLQLDPQKPIVFIMCHTFSDACHVDDRNIYNDYYEWLEETLNAASRIPQVNWIVKPHPDDKFYNSREDHATVLAKNYLHHSFIALSPSDLNTNSIPAMAHAIVTVRGTAGLEFSALGIPCIVAGGFFYTSLGFTHEPADHAEYISMLENIHSMTRLTDEQIRRAKTCCYTYLYLPMIECILQPQVPPHIFGGNLDVAQFWIDALEAVTSHTIDEDPLYQNFNKFIQFDLPHLMKLESYQELEKALLLNQEGEKLFSLGRNAEAETLFRSAMEVAPYCLVARNNLGVVLWQKGETKEAFHCFREVLAINPEDSTTLENLQAILGTAPQDTETDSAARQ